MTSPKPAVFAPPHVIGWSGKHAQVSLSRGERNSIPSCPGKGTRGFTAKSTAASSEYPRPVGGPRKVRSKITNWEPVRPERSPPLPKYRGAAGAFTRFLLDAGSNIFCGTAELTRFGSAVSPITSLPASPSSPPPLTRPGLSSSRRGERRTRNAGSMTFFAPTRHRRTNPLARRM